MVLQDGVRTLNGEISAFGSIGFFDMTFAKGRLTGVPAAVDCGASFTAKAEYRFEDLGTDGVLAKTWPLMACVSSCTGIGGGPPVAPDGLGMVNFIDQYCPPGALLSSFTFGTSGPSYYTSISMDIREAAISTIATTSVVAGNTAVLTEVTSIGLGTGGAFSLDCSMATVGNKLTIWRVGFAPLTPPLASKWGNILVPISAGTGQNFILGFHNQSAAVPFSVPDAAVPKDLSFACAPFGFQAFCGDAPKGFLSNGLQSQLNVKPLNFDIQVHTETGEGRVGRPERTGFGKSRAHRAQ